MAKIIFDGVEEITPETAMKWFPWYVLVQSMELNQEALDTAINAVERNIPDWEMQVLKKFLEVSSRNLYVV